LTNKQGEIMGLGDFIKSKVHDGKKAVIKSKAKTAIKEKFNIDNQFDSKVDFALDKAIDKVGADNIINAKKIYDNIKDKNSQKNN